MIKKNNNINFKLLNFVNINIKSTTNNIILTISDKIGNIYFWSSSGTAGFKGTRKSTPYAAQCATKLIISKLKELKLQKINIIIKGKGVARETPIKLLKNFGFKILSITDKSSIAFNGCRLPKQRKL